MSMLSSFVVFPELFLGSAGVLGLLYGVFSHSENSNLTRWFALFSLGGALTISIFTLYALPSMNTYVFENLCVSNLFINYAKVIVLLGTLSVFWMARNDLTSAELDRFEYPLLVIFMTVGMLFMLGANDLLTLFIGMELQSLSLYVMTALARDRIEANEAALKYLILGAIATGLFLYGTTLLYGISGTTNFNELQNVIGRALQVNNFLLQPALSMGLHFVISSFAFKMAIAPFHMWVPDVYQGSPTPVTAFLASVPKVVATALLARLLLGPLSIMQTYWSSIATVLAILSLVIGALGAIPQVNFKRFLAYSSISQMGFIFLGFTTDSQGALQGIILYAVLYLIAIIGVFACLLALGRGYAITKLNDFAGLGEKSPLIALILTILMFSLAGIPPLSGFFAKFYILMALLDQENYLLAVVAMLTSVIAAFYYIRIVKIMYFEEISADTQSRVKTSGKLEIVMVGSALVSVLFFVYPGFLLSRSLTASTILLFAR